VAEAAGAGGLTLAQVAQRAGVSPATVRRWVAEGVVPVYDGHWTAPAAAHVRMVARMRARGHTLEEIREASESGRLATGFIEDLLPAREQRYGMREASRRTGVEPNLIERIITAIGLPSPAAEGLSDEDLVMLRYQNALIQAGLPLPVVLQLARVYGQAFAQIADAEVRLIHMYVHEPLIREGTPALEIAETMEGMAKEMLPFVAPIMDYLHGQFLRQFMEEDMIGHMEGEARGPAPELGRVRAAFAFADLAGYTRLTEERGEQEAVGAVERFVDAVARTLPIGARVIKTLGDEVMIVASDPVALTGWAVDFEAQVPDGVPRPRMGIHYGEAVYRDGDYYGREVNQAARVVARAGGGEVLVTRAVAEEARGASGLRFRPIGEVGLKGFSEPTELFLATIAEG
jgi:adenylate cyclase